MFQRLLQMLIKEFLQVFRDKRARTLLFVPPMVQMMVFGYAATFEIRHVTTAIADQDRTPESREFISRFTATRYFDVRAWPADPQELPALIDRGEAILAIHIKPGFGQKLRKGQTASVQAIADSTVSNTALIALGYLERIAGEFAAEYGRDRLERIQPLLVKRIPQVELERRPWYNTDLSSRWFFIPGVIGSLILVMVTTLTAFAVVREREVGTLEQIMVTPIRRGEFILGKTLPFFLIGLADAALIATVGTFWFEIPFRGQVWVLLLGVMLFLLSVLGVALLVSTISSTQQQAMVTTFFFIMPAITFSGFAFPITAMPEVLQWVSYLNPLRYILVVLRGVYLKGVGLEILWPQMLAMAAIAFVLLTLSIVRFHKALD